jgi:DNA adenine methylase
MDVTDVPECNLEPMDNKEFLTLRLVTPFRYPGAKTRLLGKVLAHLKPMLSSKTTYVEPFVGGGSVFIGVLQCCLNIKKVIINDFDPAVASFWWCVADKDMSKELAQRVADANVTVEEHERQREKMKSDSPIDRAFAALFLNRCSFSGMLESGPIGGREQKSKYTVDCRYNAEVLAKRILDISKVAIGRVDVWCEDFGGIIDMFDEKHAVFYCDAPYYEMGNSLYRFGMSEEDHDRLAAKLRHLKNGDFVASYDAVKPILDKYYDWATLKRIDARYSISGKDRDSWEGKQEFVITRSQ